MGLAHLRNSRPEWFTITEERANSLFGRTNVRIAGAAKAYQVDLKIKDFGDAIFASEITPSRLPVSCPERHINNDSTLCLQYDASTLPRTLDGARVWWGLLREFLVYQYIATRTGMWPPEAYISHGDAGVHHLKARQAAQALGLSEIYRKVIRGESTWINNGTIKLDKGSSRLLNGRSACPVGCNKGNRRLLRRKCCKKHDLLTLMLEEQLRSQKENEFWEEYKTQGATCCETMRTCPLRSRREADN